MLREVSFFAYSGSLDRIKRNYDTKVENTEIGVLRVKSNINKKLKHLIFNNDAGVVISLCIKQFLGFHLRAMNSTHRKQCTFMFRSTGQT